MDTPLGGVIFCALLVTVALSAGIWEIGHRVWWSEPVQEFVLRHVGHSRLVPVRGGNRISPRTPRLLPRPVASPRVTAARGDHQHTVAAGDPDNPAAAVHHPAGTP